MNKRRISERAVIGMYLCEGYMRIMKLKNDKKLEFRMLLNLQEIQRLVLWACTIWQGKIIKIRLY